MFDFQFEAGDVDMGHNPRDIFDLPPRESWVITQHLSDFRYRFDGEWIESAPGVIIIVSPDATFHHGPLVGAKEGYVYDWCYINAPRMSELLKNLRLPVNQAFDVLNNKFIDPYIRRIQAERRASRLGYESIVSSIIVEMFVEMARLYEKKQNVQFPQKQMLEKIRNEMLLNYGYNWNLGDLAAKAGYSSAYFCSLYRQYYSTAPIDDLLKYRMMIAREELTLKNLTVTEISEKCGFSSIHHFSYYFKKCFGVSPSKFNK